VFVNLVTLFTLNTIYQGLLNYWLASRICWHFLTVLHQFVLKCKKESVSIINLRCSQTFENSFIESTARNVDLKCSSNVAVITATETTSKILW